MTEQAEARINQHYSVQTGHALRGEHARVVRTLGGFMPEGVIGFHKLDAQRVRRSMRRISATGKR